MTLHKTKKKVCIITSGHSSLDIRIFLKEAKSLSKAGYEVTIIAQHDRTESIEGIRIISLPRAVNRIHRMTKIVMHSYYVARSINADIYHFHEPELIPVGLLLKRLGKPVIFDSHEDLPKQLLSKPYLEPISLKILSSFFSLFESVACKHLDGIIAATPFIRDKFLNINPRTVDINNYPLIGELDSAISWNEKCDEVSYVGGISSIRGIVEVVRSLEFVKTAARLNLAGKFTEPAVETQVKTLYGWGRVNELGFLDRASVREVLGRSVAGLVTFHSKPNHTDAQPNKMFEYMSAGIPVIASNFPLWRDIIESNECGICVNPLDPIEIARAIDHFILNPELARCMGENGRQAVLNKYNWSIEEKKLLEFYDVIIRRK